MKAYLFIFISTKIPYVDYGAQIIYVDNLNDAIKSFEEDHKDVNDYKVKELTPELNKFGFHYKEATND